MYIGLHVNYPYSCQILMKLRFLNRFFNNTQISNFVKIRSLGTEFVPCGQADRQTDMTKLITAFRN